MDSLIWIVRGLLFTNGGDGYVGTGSNGGTLQLEEALIMDLNEEKALEEKYADYDDFI